MDGVCHICRTYSKLSYEHVPPSAAFNDVPVDTYALEEWLKRSEGQRARATVRQRGFGAYTLCIPCNTTTGHWYGGEFVQWAVSTRTLVDRLPADDVGPYRIGFGRSYPLRFLKQVIEVLPKGVDEGRRRAAYPSA